MTGALYLFLFGEVLIGSAFMLASFGRLALLEYRSGREIGHSTYFWLCLFLATLAAGMALWTGALIYDALHRGMQYLAKIGPVSLVTRFVGVGLIVGAHVGLIHNARARGSERTWPVFLIASLAWAIVVVATS